MDSPRQTVDLKRAIFGAVEAYSALIQFHALIPGEERALLYGAAKAKLTGADSEQIAWLVSDFLPIAVARPELERSGVDLSEFYIRTDSQGRIRNYRRLLEEPVYVQARALVEELTQSHGDTVGQIQQMSVELQFVKRALAKGSRAANLQAGPPIFSGPDELCDPLDQQPKFDQTPWWMADFKKQQRPWWKFW